MRTIYLGLLTFAVSVTWVGTSEELRLNDVRGRMDLGLLAPRSTQRSHGL